MASEKLNPPLLSQDLMELAQSLTVEETSAKLRCASCNKLAVNAFKLPCCDQSICERCRDNLPENCPVCDHSPLTPDLCSPNKSLRLTIKAHLMGIMAKKKNKSTSEAKNPPSAASTRSATPNGDVQGKEAAATAPAPAAAKGTGGQNKVPPKVQGVKPTPQNPISQNATPTDKRAPAGSQAQSDDEAGYDSDDDVEWILYSPAMEYEWQTVLNDNRRRFGIKEKRISKALWAAFVERKTRELDVLQQRTQYCNAIEAHQQSDSRRNSNHSNKSNQKQQAESAQKQSNGKAQDQAEKQDQVHDQTKTQSQANTPADSHTEANAQIQGHDQNQGHPQNQGNGQNQGYGQNQGWGQNQMDFNNGMVDFNTMMAMQNMMNMQNMMGMYLQNTLNTDPGSRLNCLQGMPGMNDPSMIFGGGFGNMGGMMMDMNAMNGMNGFGGMPDMGAMNSGAFFPQNGGYNPQQNFGASQMMNNSNFYPQNNRGYAGRGQYNNRGGAYGRGGRGFHNRSRGGWQNQDQYQYQGQNANNMHFQQQTPQSFRGNDETIDLSAQQGATRGSPSYESMHGANGTVTDAKLLTSSTEGDAAGANVSATIDNANHTGNALAEQSKNEPEKGGEGVTQDTAQSTGSNVGMQAHEAMNSHGADYRARGGAYGSAAKPINTGAVQPQAAPINAPTGPKAMRQGPQNAHFSRSQPSVASAVAASPIEPDHSKSAASEARGRKRSRSPSRSHKEGQKARHRSPHKRDESRVSREHNSRDSRKRKERTEYYDEKHNREVNGDRPTKKVRSESPESGNTTRHHGEKDETRHSSRSRRESSRDRRKERHRSRSPKKDRSGNDDERRKDRYRSRSPKRDKDVKDEERDSSRHKSRSDKKREDGYGASDKKDRGRSHKHSSRRHEEDDRENKERTSHSSSHHRGSTDGKYRDREYDRGERERDRRRSAIDDLAQDGGEFKIKGRSAALKHTEKATSETRRSEKQGHNAISGTSTSEKVKSSADSSMRPPTTFKPERNERRGSAATSNDATPMVDIYAAEREKARKNREEMQLKRIEGRRVSNQSLGKHSRDNDTFDAPTGPSGNSSKRPKKDMRKHVHKFEGEVDDGHDLRDSRRFR